MGRHDGSSNNNNNNNNIRWGCCFWLRKRDLFYGLLLLIVPLILLLQGSVNAVLSSSLSAILFLDEGYLQQQHQHDDSSSSSSFASSSPSSLISSSSSTPAPSYWSLSDPEWPMEPPTLLPDCKVVFRKNDDNNNRSSDLLPQRLCHIVPWGANFGDELGPPIVKRILELYFRCSAQDLPTLNMAQLSNKHMNRSSAQEGTGSGPCLLSVGSLWRMAHSGDHLWGTGVAFDGTVRHRCTRDKNYRIHNLTIYSSRGPHSAAQIHQYCPFGAIYNTNSKTSIPSAGDAGFLVPYLFPEHVPRDIWPPETKQPAAFTNNVTATNSSSRLCIIPHHDERNNPQFRRVEHEYGAIRLTVQQSWQDMATSMLTKCDRVLSSSLHGIIFAETLGLASKRFRLTQQPGDFKFDDFYASYRGGGPATTGQSSGGGNDIGSDSATTAATTAIKSMEHLYARNLTSALNDWIQPLSMQQRDAYARRILETFPIHLFEAVQQEQRTAASS